VKNPDDQVGAFANDNIMITIAAYVAEDSRTAKDSILGARSNYLVSNVFRYHDTFPHPEFVPYWPETLPDVTEESIPFLTESGATIIGDPDEALAQCQRWADTGVDQISFGIGPAPLADTLEMIRIMGEHVIPKLDKEPGNKSSRLRDAAADAPAPK
jgi:alkanesulfonate monooxygenase SsuD/methylene tetrahydromethanopterin reductase-like flavin-dependent oxidoreductase (luciferase family)